jgi:hypothetical protein
MFVCKVEGLVPIGSKWVKFLYFGLLLQIVLSVIDGFFFYDDRSAWIAVIGLVGIHMASSRGIYLFIGANGISVILDIIRVIISSFDCFIVI